jgi:DNA-binding SARP family transcriptional activator
MHDLEFRILGPIDASVTGKTVKLGGRRSRQVLAGLLLHAGRPVSAERLIDTVWDDNPPASARTQLAIQVSALRRAFGKAGCDQEVIETTATGYRLNDQTAWLDAEAAEHALASAQALTDREDAADRLRTALSWWRGPALTGLSTPDLEAAARRLGELRLTIAEELYDVEFALGRHRALIGELTTLVAEEPWRERLRGQLMTALWRSGRQADALEVYEEGRRLLANDLGLEPGPELRELERAILANDSTPMPTRTGPITGPGREQDNRDARHVIPAELPPDVPVFIGRAEQIARMHTLLTAEWPDLAPAFALAGTGGVGKSALAIHVGHRVIDSFPDGQLYVNLHGSTPDVKPLEPAEALSRLLRSLGVDEASIPRDADEAAGRFRSVTSGKRLLIVLDNARDVAQVTPLLPAGRSCRVIVTSRRILGDLTTAVHEQLDVFPETEAVRLLSQLIGPERFDPTAATEVVRLCGRLPLAVSVVASRLIRRPAWTLPMLADRLGSEAQRLRELETDDRAIRTSFEVGYRELDAGQRRMFRLLSQLDGADVPTGAAAALANLPDVPAERLLEVLVDAQLIESHVPGRYRLHDLLRLFARERAAEEDPAEERAAAVRRAAHYYLATARNACLLLNKDAAWRTEVEPGVLDNAGRELRDRDDAYAWLDSDGENLLAIARQAIASVDGGTALAAAICSAVGLGWTLRGRHRDKLTLGELVLRSAGRTGDVLHQAIAHDSIG